MNQFTWIIDVVREQVAHLKAVIIMILRYMPFLKNMSDGQLEWVFLGIIFAVSIFIIIPLFKYSVKISVAAVALAATVSFLSSYSFWGLLPFTGLGVAVVLFSNKFQMG